MSYYQHKVHKNYVPFREMGYVIFQQGGNITDDQLLHEYSQIRSIDSNVERLFINDYDYVNEVKKIVDWLIRTDRLIDFEWFMGQIYDYLSFKDSIFEGSPRLIATERLNGYAVEKAAEYGNLEALKFAVSHNDNNYINSEILMDDALRSAALHNRVNVLTMYYPEFEAHARDIFRTLVRQFTKNVPRYPVIKMLLDVIPAKDMIVEAMAEGELQMFKDIESIIGTGETDNILSFLSSRSGQSWGINLSDIDIYYNTLYIGGGSFNVPYNDNDYKLLKDFQDYIIFYYRLIIPLFPGPDAL